MREDIKTIAVQFAPETKAQGWGVIHQERIPLRIVGVDGNLTYLFSSERWQVIEHRLNENDIPYIFKQATRMTKRFLENPLGWE